MSEDSSELASRPRRALRMPRTAGALIAIPPGLAAMCLLAMSMRVPNRRWRFDPRAQLAQPHEGLAVCYPSEDQAANALPER